MMLSYAALNSHSEHSSKYYSMQQADRMLWKIVFYVLFRDFHQKTPVRMRTSHLISLVRHTVIQHKYAQFDILQ